MIRIRMVGREIESNRAEARVWIELDRNLPLSHSLSDRVSSYRSTEPFRQMLRWYDILHSKDDICASVNRLSVCEGWLSSLV